MNDVNLLKDVLPPVFETHGLKLAVVFGSVAAGSARLDSDLDIAVDRGERPREFGEHGSLVTDIGEAARRAGVDREIDVAYLNHADPLFLKKIFEMAVLVYGADRDFQAWRLRAFRYYQDFKPYLKLEAETARRLAERLAG